jgi:hypothetical protein
MGERIDLCCKETKKLIVAHLTGTLGRDGRNVLLRHMRACPECWQLVGHVAKSSELPYARTLSLSRKAVSI